MKWRRPLDQRIALAHRAQVAHQRQRVGIGRRSMRSVSTTGSAKPARCSRPPRSRRSAKGETRGLAPPSISQLGLDQRLAQLARASRRPRAREQQARPAAAMWRSWISAPGRSLVQCSARLLATRSKEPARRAAPRPRPTTAAARAARAQAEGRRSPGDSMPPRPPSARASAPRPLPRSSARAKVPGDVGEPVGQPLAPPRRRGNRRRPAAPPARDGGARPRDRRVDGSAMQAEIGSSASQSTLPHVGRPAFPRAGMTIGCARSRGG